jgi:tetratricopeptide (TPR) repeat protein
MDEISFKYDVFISYNHKDEEWVLNKLLPTLENAGLRVCIDFRDFEVGEIAIRDIQNHIKESNHIIFVLTKNWLSGKWTHFESFIASTINPTGSERKIIPLLLEEGIQDDIPEFIAMRNWLEFHNNIIEDTSWQQLIKTLTKEKTQNSMESLKMFHNLPPRKEFVGRKEEKAKGHQALLLNHPNIISIDGIGGVGKTALALELVYECWDASMATRKKPKDQIAIFDSFIWTTAKDHELALDNILDEVARTTGSDFIMKQSLAEKKNSVQNIFRDKRCLLVVDGYETIKDKDIHHFLTNVPETSKVLITTREPRIESRFISIKGLPKEDALELIRYHGKILGLTSIETAADIVLERIWEATDGHPLAMKWVLGQIKQKGQSLEVVLDFLSNAEGNIFDYIFSRSWKLLSPTAKQILRIMPVFEIDGEQQAIERASGINGKSFNTALGQLVEMSLVHASDTLEKRYSLHPLTRAFSSKKLQVEPEIKLRAQKNLAIFFEEYTLKNGGLWNLSGFEKLKLDIFNIISIIKWCWEKQYFELGVNIFGNIRYFIINHGYWNSALDLAFEAIKLFPIQTANIPNVLDEWQKKIISFRIWPIAWIYRFRGDYKTSKDMIYFSLEIFEHIGDASNIAIAKRHLGLVLQESGEIHEAEKCLKESLDFEILQKNNYRVQLLTADLASLALQGGDLDTAWGLSKIVLDQSHNIEDSQCVARFYRVLGSVARQRNKILEAKEMFEKSLEHTKGLKYVDGMADAVYELAIIDMEMGQNHEARQKYEQAHRMYKALGMEKRAIEIKSVFAKILEEDYERQ